MKKHKGMFVCVMGMLAIMLVSAGCSKAEIEVQEPDINVYESVTLPLDGLEEEEYIWNLCCSNNEIFFSAYNRAEGIEAEVPKTHVYKYDLKNQKADKIPIILESDKHIICLSKKHGGAFVMLLSKEDKYYIAKYDDTGACV